MRGLLSSRRSEVEQSREGNPLTRLDLFLVMLSIFSRIRRQETTRPVIPPETKASLSLSVIWVETEIKDSQRGWQD